MPRERKVTLEDLKGRLMGIADQAGTETHEGRGQALDALKIVATILLKEEAQSGAPRIPAHFLEKKVTALEEETE